MSDWWSALFDFRDYGALLALLHNSVLAGAVLGIAGGLIGVFVMTRDLAFAVHGVSELSFAGAAAGLLFGVGVVEGSIIGSLVAAVIIGVLGARARERNSITAVLMPAGLGLGILCLALYPGRASTKFSMRRRVTVGASNASPPATTRTARSRSSGSLSLRMIVITFRPTKRSRSYGHKRCRNIRRCAPRWRD